MCQLLGMNANVPTDICFSFAGFHRRGGQTDEHKDGFGIAFFEDDGYRLFNDPQPAINSPIAKLVEEYPIRSKNVIAHIRKATKGQVSLVNCHPFIRELWGKYWVFAHNGDVANAEFSHPIFYHSVGTTDSEQAFCALLDSLRVRFGETPPSLEELYFFLKEVTSNIAKHGIFNYLLSNGDYLFAHCSTKLSYIVRKAPFGMAHLIDDDVSIDFRQHTSETDCVAVIATLPLTDNEEWTICNSGDLLVFHNGECLNLTELHDTETE